MIKWISISLEKELVKRGCESQKLKMIWFLDILYEDIAALDEDLKNLEDIRSYQ